MNKNYKWLDDRDLSITCQKYSSIKNRAELNGIYWQSYHSFVELNRFKKGYYHSENNASYVGWYKTQYCICGFGLKGSY